MVHAGYLEQPMDGNHGEIHPKNDDYVAAGVPFIMANDLKGGYVDYHNCNFIRQEQANQLRKGFAKAGDVLLTHKATIGRTAIVTDEYPVTILTPQITYYRTKNNLYNGFLRYYFETNIFQSTLASWAGAGSTRAYIGITKQLDLPINIPNNELMDKLRSFIIPIEKLRVQNDNELSELIKFQAVLLSRLSSR